MIRFGTDGWRAVIADGFTFENLTRVAHATANWILKIDTENPGVVVGHDSRFSGRAFAERVAAVFASRGITVLFADGVTPTPAISWATKEFNKTAGVVITASHNPPQYNGFKIKGSFGGSALPEMIAAVESELLTIENDHPAVDFDIEQRSDRINVFDIRGAYIESIREKIDVASILESGLRIVHDVMHGAGMGVLTDILGEAAVVELHGSINPSFGGTPPEPIENNLGELAEAVIENKCAAGIAKRRRRRSDRDVR